MVRIGKGLGLYLAVLFALFMAVGTALAMDHAVQTMKKEGAGNYLADAKGTTLYWFTKDTPGKSACSGPCVEKWPLFFREKVMAGTGLKEGDFGTITREDGKKQTTFRGYPLYYWMGDKAKGDTNGQGMNKVWYVVDPANFPPKM